ncbi:hypothetical protein QWY75_07900 [Pontixanthobacter aestiaquae]|uniref:TspO and MBR related proteins n=1 Tax=Pontixanthobacter aestiaquae TaxID=1509367 RepID=A0A844Z7T5_9SPHN|nr:hypothetical protein [Pontixanthobacter aestiaquae]MDN3646128.1 hypothetical protein [Pontixanthobacter aestiaquae]MXO82880.1 hypothetical protein [Pontixanthobacter aestiaquae]
MQTSAPTTRSTLQILAIVLAVIWQIGATFLPNFGLGEPIGQRSDAIRTLVVPSGWAFAIWGPLFLGCAIYAVWQALPGQRDNPLVASIGWYTAGATAANGLWATYTQFYNLTFISALIILFSLVCLLATLRALVAWEKPFTKGERWITALTFSALAAWLTVASTVNITAALKYHGVGAGSSYPMLAAAIVLVAGLIGSAAATGARGNPWYSVVILWAMLAIYFKGGQEHFAIAVATGLSTLMVAFSCLRKLSGRSDRQHWLGF